jgi:hypothetical protein
MSTLPVAFSYQLDRPFDLSVNSLRGWRPSGVRGVELARSSLEDLDTQVSRYRLVLRLRHHGRSLALELRVTPWSDQSNTYVELMPLRHLRPNRRYFRAGRVLIAQAVGTIQAHDPAGQPPAVGGLARSA